MANIIEYGSGHIDRGVEYRCSGCQSRIRFFRADIRDDQRGRQYVECPVCCAFIDRSVVFVRGQSEET